AITNIKGEALNTLYNTNTGGKLKVVSKGKQTDLKNYYSEVTDKGLYSLVNSTGYLELFVYRGNAAALFDIKIGDIVGVMLMG
ncbi:MAG: SAM hydroxide adenosyltransferase, partial [Thermodesulfobacteriota bacterium]